MEKLKLFRGRVRCPQVIFTVQAPDINSAEQKIIDEFLEDKMVPVVDEIQELTEGEEDLTEK